MLKFIIISIVCLCGNLFGAMRITGYNPARHDRFYDGADKAFIGEQLDWSGIGHDVNGRWVTMISPTCGLTITHWPAYGAVTFYEENTTAHGSHVVNVLSRVDISGSDLSVLHLASQPPVATYALPGYADDWYIGTNLWLCGSPNRVGRNEGTEITSFPYHELLMSVMEGTPDEAYVQTGDSGGPTVVLLNGMRSMGIVGLHRRIGMAQPGNKLSDNDSYVPFWVPQIRAIVNSYGEDITLLHRATTGDANDDGLVDLQDFSLVKAHFGSAGNWADGDFNFDGFIDLQDFGLLKDNFGSSISVVPEPATAWLVVLALWATARRR